MIPRLTGSPPALTPGDRIRLARENLCLAMALFAASHQGLITTSFVTQSADLYLPNGDVVDALRPPEIVRQRRPGEMCRQPDSRLVRPVRVANPP